MKKYKYKTVNQNGKIHRFRCWVEDFKDEDTGKLIPIQRHQLIKINGKSVFWTAANRKRKPGGGRKPGEPTKVIRVPVSKLSQIKDLINGKSSDSL